MKKIFFLIGLLLSLTFAAKASAAEVGIQDDASLIDDSVEAELLEKMTTEAELLHSGIYILTTYDATDDNQTYSDNYLASKVGYNNNGIVLVINMNIRNMHISTSGLMIDFWTQSRLNTTLDEIQEDLKASQYDAAVTLFTERVSKYRKEGIPGKSYHISANGKLVIQKAISLTEATIAALIGLIASGAFFITTRLKYQLKLGNYHYDYQENSHIKLIENNDQLIRSFVTTRVIPKPPSNNGGGFGGGTHSTGGGSFGGGGRSF
ncbi:MULTISPECIES: TPM domain-containing protein [unclassified Enterococcus]|uniref:TPM domain-containing protein n=1 Tax=unclassified Enterococcus TaxID=2608891 RepID=UPI0015533B78|nr:MULTISPECIES: TPM domain-containing protein [unclassified Enterococcus]MBS7576603.1 TPM domain-containing protein [Enterococcus sp. MMGLQ5-2]MBS7583910.1 TPM domain-containing protein [Enterococcus sp. MMGLQ5-1]NPD11771.1 TPM domain-containing protein [Enterococcus sp. MMGLQ5-1]NPD36440.1 TPM domain-containing protein [Enterococcus sp. MMGLQ5-2]